MRINQLHLENFKAFKDCRINFRPLTLLTGTNSSGKSTVLNAITAVLQTQLPHLFPFEFIPNGKNCALGSFRDIAHGKNTRTNFTVEMELRRGKTQFTISGRYRYSSSGSPILPDAIRYQSEGHSLQLSWRGQSVGYKIDIDSNIYSSATKDKAFERFKEALQAYILESRKATTNAKPTDDTLLDTAFPSHSSEEYTLRSRTPLDITRELRQKPLGRHLVRRITELMEYFAAEFSYIGPIRAYPSRYYSTEDVGAIVDPMGKNAIPILYDWKRHFPARHREVLQLLGDLELASKVSTRTGLNDILKIDVRAFDHSELVNFADVGFGISQVLPVLVADVALPKGGTLIVNQPEVHLHPSSQALLANYFSSRLSKRNYIIETHSEYLINRLRLLAARHEIDIKDIVIIFLEPSSDMLGTPQVHHIELTEDGSLTNAPKSFFQTYYLDSFNIAMGGLSKNAS